MPEKMEKKKIILFQKYLRSHILNFGKHLINYEFILKSKEESTKNLYQRIATFENETNRKKAGIVLRLRRIIGIPNFRIKFSKDGDLFFTYGCFLLTNKPYAVYIENGISIYKYDPAIASNPVARMIVSFLIKRKRCKKLIFMSKTAQKSFLSSVKYSENTKKIIQEKSVQCYPLIIAKGINEPKKFNGKIRLLFAGTFYVKGGIEVLNAFEKLRKIHKNIVLTVITQLKPLRKLDIDRMKSMEGVTLLNAEFNSVQMNEFFKNNDILILPTYRDSFGMILIEALSLGMPIITTDQYATTEMVIDNYNGFVCPDHPMKDYDILTFKIFGKYYQPKDFYSDYFRKQKNGEFRTIENFLYNSVNKLIENPNLLEKFSENSINHYNKNFHSDIIRKKIEEIFSEALKQ